MENTFIPNNTIWNEPILIEAREAGETVEFLYKQHTINYYTTSTSKIHENARIFKIIFSCKDGKWHKSNPIYGRIIPRSDEQYVFDN